MDHVSLSHAPNSDDPGWYLILHQVPFWFPIAFRLCDRWPLSRFHQAYTLWWWDRLHGYPSVRVKVSQIDHDAVLNYWDAARGR